MPPAITPLVERDNAYYLNAFRGRMGQDYKDHVPEATQANVSETMKALYDYEGGLNQFTNSLVNRIGKVEIRNQSWTNPIAKFKQGILEYGATVEESQIGLIDSYAYDHDRSSGAEELFKRNRPNVKTIFHTINREEKYPFTVDYKNLKRAFLDPMGVHKFVSALSVAAVTSANRDEFLIMANLFSEYHKNNGFYTVNIPDVGAEESTAAQARYALRRITEITEELPFLNARFNAAHMDTSTNGKEIELFCTPEFKAAIDIEALAAVFQKDKASLPDNITVIPSRFFAIEGVQAILTTRDFFQVYDVLLETTSMNNAAGLYENFWLHVHQIISVSTFVPAIMFWDGPSTVDEVIETPVVGIEELIIEDSAGTVVTSAERGRIYQINGSAITAPDGGNNDAISLRLLGRQSSRTYLSPTNALFVSHDEKATSLVVVATSVDDPDYTRTLSIPITGDRLELFPVGYVEDADNDGLLEAIPKAPVQTANKVKITPATGVEYRDGATPVTGTITLTANKTITAVATTGYELKPGATASWPFVFTA